MLPRRSDFGILANNAFDVAVGDPFPAPKAELNFQKHPTWSNLVQPPNVSPVPKIGSGEVSPVLLHQAGLVFHRIQAIRQGHNLSLLQLNDSLQLGHLQEHELDVTTQAAHPRITLRLVGGLGGNNGSANSCWGRYSPCVYM